MIVVFPLLPRIVSPVVSVVVVLTVVIVAVVVVPIAVLPHELVPKTRNCITGMVRCRSQDELQRTDYQKAMI